MLDAFDYLCQPLESRGLEWEPEEFAVIPQTTIISFFDKIDRKFINCGIDADVTDRTFRGQPQTKMDCSTRRRRERG